MTPMKRMACLIALAGGAAIAGSTQCSAGGRLDAVTPVDGGCVAGPTGNSNVESWDIEPGKTYTLTFAGITDCANGGTAATVSIMIKNTYYGNACFTAAFVSTGVYQFDYLVPATTCETSPMRYCVTDCAPNTGFEVGKKDGTGGAAHLRASTFGPGCTSPIEIGCPTPVEPATWGVIKSIYR